MNILLWILQISLALWETVGAIYMVQHYEQLARAWALNTLPAPAWMAIGVLQLLFALGLILPGAFRVLPRLTPISAASLALLSVLGIVLYVAYTGWGVLWGVVPAILLAFVAYGRLALKA